jgi:hypothetical protein
MDVLKGLLKPRPTPQQLLREWQRRLRNERLVLDRRIRGNFVLYSPPPVFPVAA